MKRKDCLILGSVILSTSVGALVCQKKRKKKNKKKFVETRKINLRKSLDFINGDDSLFVEVAGSKDIYPGKKTYLKELKKGQIIPAKMSYDFDHRIYIVSIIVDDRWIPCGFIQEEVKNKDNKTGFEINELLSYYKITKGKIPAVEINLVGVESNGIMKAELKILKEGVHEISKFAKELRETINSKKEIVEENEKEENVEENKKVEVKEDDKFIYSSFFQTNIKKEYEKYIIKFLDSNNVSIFKYVVKFVFNEDGDFNYDVLKKLLAERYFNIKNIVTSEIFDMPSLVIFPLERYLQEIDTLSESKVEDKVEGILTYWLTIAESLSSTDII